MQERPPELVTKQQTRAREPVVARAGPRVSHREQVLEREDIDLDRKAKLSQRKTRHKFSVTETDSISSTRLVKCRISSWSSKRSFLRSKHGFLVSTSKLSAITKVQAVHGKLNQQAKSNSG